MGGLGGIWGPPKLSLQGATLIFGPWGGLVGGEVAIASASGKGNCNCKCKVLVARAIARDQGDLQVQGVRARRASARG